MFSLEKRILWKDMTAVFKYPKDDYTENRKKRIKVVSGDNEETMSLNYNQAVFSF